MLINCGRNNSKLVMIKFSPILMCYFDVSSHSIFTISIHSQFPYYTRSHAVHARNFAWYRRFYHALVHTEIYTKRRDPHPNGGDQCRLIRTFNSTAAQDRLHNRVSGTNTCCTIQGEGVSSPYENRLLIWVYPYEADTMCVYHVHSNAGAIHIHRDMTLDHWTGNYVSWVTH